MKRMKEREVEDNMKYREKLNEIDMEIRRACKGDSSSSAAIRSNLPRKFLTYFKQIHNEVY